MHIIQINEVWFLHNPVTIVSNYQMWRHWPPTIHMRIIPVVRSYFNFIYSGDRVLNSIISKNSDCLDNSNQNMQSSVVSTSNCHYTHVLSVSANIIYPGLTRLNPANPERECQYVATYYCYYYYWQFKHGPGR